MSAAKHTPGPWSPWTAPSEAVPQDGMRVFAETDAGSLVFCTYRDDEWQSSNGVHAYKVTRWMCEDGLRAAIAKATGSAS